MRVYAASKRPRMRHTAAAFTSVATGPDRLLSAFLDY